MGGHALHRSDAGLPRGRRAGLDARPPPAGRCSPAVVPAPWRRPTSAPTSPVARSSSTGPGHCLAAAPDYRVEPRRLARRPRSRSATAGRRTVAGRSPPSRPGSTGTSRPTFRDGDRQVLLQCPAGGHPAAPLPRRDRVPARGSRDGAGDLPGEPPRTSSRGPRRSGRPAGAGRGRVLDPGSFPPGRCSARLGEGRPTGQAYIWRTTPMRRRGSCAADRSSVQGASPPGWPG